MYLVAECKRVDPARANWCFVKAPFTHEDLYDARDLVFQTVTYSWTLVKAFVPEPRLKQASLPSTHLGFELRTGLKGDGGGSAAGGAINEAATQVLRGMNGLIDQLEPGLADGVSLFVPVIFTTARLWVADGGDISLADLNTGQLPSEPWLWYTYNQSPALRHHVPSGGAPSLSLSKILRAEFARSIAVVGPDGIEPFLRADLATWLA